MVSTMETHVPRDSVGSRLRVARERAGISARELDRLARSKSDGLAAKVEKGERPNIEASTAAEYARTLGVSLDWLINGIGAHPSARRIRSAVEAAKAQREAA